MQLAKKKKEKLPLETDDNAVREYMRRLVTTFGAQPTADDNTLRLDDACDAPRPFHAAVDRNTGRQFCFRVCTLNDAVADRSDGDGVRMAALCFCASQIIGCERRGSSSGRRPPTGRTPISTP